jgi:L-malate glycosyltransferase
LRSLHVDAIHLHHFLGLNKLGVPARLAGIKRIVVTEHSVLDVNQSLAGRVRARLSWRLASCITVIHQSIKDYLCGEIGIADDRIVVVPIGIKMEDYAHLDRLARRNALSCDVPITFVFVGRLAPVKNVPGLIAAFLAVQARRSGQAKLIVVGDGEDRARCQELVGSHAMGHCVELVGAQLDPRPYLGAADVFVLNSRSEGTPRALLEAMAGGLPAIGPEVGGIPDMLAGRGWLTKPDDQRSLEAAIELVLNQPDVVPKLGALARQYVKANFDSKHVTARYRQLLIG